MKKNLKRKVLCLALSVCMTVSNIPGGGSPVFAYIAESTPHKESITLEGSSLKGPETSTDSNGTDSSGPANLIVDSKASSSDAKTLADWTLDRPQGNEVLEMDGDWIHFKGGAGNNNDDKPAVLLNNKKTEIKDGLMEFTFKSKDEVAKTRFGVYARYQSPKKAVFVGYNNNGWYWQVYDGVNNPYYPGSDKPGPAAGVETTVRIEYSGNTMNVYLNDEVLFSDIDISSVPEPGGVGFRIGYFGEAQPTDVLIKDVVFEKGKTYSVSGTVKDEANNPIKGATVTVGSKSSVTENDGTFTLGEVSKGKHDLSVTKTGFELKTQEIIVADNDLSGINVVMKARDLGAVKEIKSDSMSVIVDEHFPRVISYTYKDKDFSGQEEKLTTVRINDVEVVPTNVETVFTDTKATYTMTLYNILSGIDADITAELEVKNNTLEFKITDIVDRKMVRTIDITNHKLVSVKSVDANAQLAGAVLSNNTQISGDRIMAVDSNLNVTQNAKVGYMYALLSNGSLSAGLWSNSDNQITDKWERITSTAAQKTGYKEVALQSTYWTFQKGPEFRKENGKIDYGDGTVVDFNELPCARVVITDDLNDDEAIDWQDGAIAYRDIMDNPLGSEKVPELVGYRVNMTFGSQAQNPFLQALDGVKKVYYNTDGLAQSVLLKGYGNEGHDSGHLNYADIGKRIGGTEDMKFLLEKGKEYGALFGVHINANETYPESKYFSDDILKVDKGEYVYAWDWIDQGFAINVDYDLNNGRASRFKDFYDELGGEENDLDFIYVDVWGDNTWRSHQLSKEINNLGWRLGGEWGHAFENASTFQHWATDLTYGDYDSKGINSDIARFIRNHQKDSWIANYSAYGGAAEAPLLGGYNMQDFEGWSGRNNYANYIKNLFEVDLPSKFAQHYLVTNMVKGTPVNMSHKGNSYKWTPEMSVTLKDAAKENILVITRDSNDYSKINEYRSRTMTFNDKIILKGREGASACLIPWNWDNEGDKLTEDNSKMYYWNSTGKETTWEVPEDWTGTAYVYELTDYGKTNMEEISIIDGEITLNLKNATPYVLYKGKTENTVVQWSENMHIIDSGFNSNSLSDWAFTGDAEGVSIVRSQGSNPMLKIAENANTVALTQELTDLKPNTNYAAYVGVDNRSEVSGIMEIAANGTLYSNSAPKSIALNYIKAYAHNTNTQNATIDNKSYFQHLYVFFTTGADGKATLTIKRDGDIKATYFDDIRIVENNAKNQVTEDKFVQDFEDVAQGIWPFVIGNVENVEDNKTHLAEKHLPYSQRGWYSKKIDDVIGGNWSVKSHNVEQRQRLVYQTIPQNFKFKPGVDYVVRFDYEAGSDNTYAVVYNDKAYSENGAYIQQKLLNTVDLGRASLYGFTLSGSDNGQTWFGIYSTDTAPDVRGSRTKGEAEFRGYMDFILDNLMIEVSPAQKPALRAVIEDALLKEERNYTEDSWKNFNYVLKASQDINNDLDADQSKVDNAVDALKKATSELVKTGGSVVGSVADTNGNSVAGVKVVMVTTDGKQYFDFSDEEGLYRIPGGFYGKNIITIDDRAYEKVQKETITAEEKETASVDFILTPAVTSLKGKVLAVGKAVKGASITLSADGLEDKNFVTDESGNYSFDNIIVKDYNLTVIMDNYDALSVVIPTTKLRSTVKELMLSPQSGIDYINDFSKGVDSLKSLYGEAKITAIDGKANIEFTKTGVVYDEDSPKFLNGSIEADFIPAKDSTRLGFVMRSTDSNNQVYAGARDSNMEWFAEHWGTGGNNWTGSYLAAGPNGNIGFKEGVKVHLKAEIVDKTIKLWVDGILTIDVTMNSMHMEPGYAGFYSRDSKIAAVDNLKITSYDESQGNMQTVVGRVLDSNGDPVENAGVFIQNGTRLDAIKKTTKTNQLGEYKFKDIPFGQYTVTVTGETGQKDVNIPIEVEKTPFYCLVDEVVQGRQPAAVKADLNNKITQAKVLVQEDYTKESWDIFENMLKEAVLCSENGTATQESVNKALLALKNAIEGLVSLGDKTLLDITISAVEDTFVENVYTPETWKAYIGALNAAKIISADVNATTEQVEKALKDLNDAVKELETKLSILDKSKLKAEIGVAEKMMSVLKKADYTSDSWAALENALSAARKCAAESTVQEEVDKALTVLQAAMKGLKIVSSGGSNGGSDGGSSGGSGSGSSGSGSSTSSKWRQNGTGWWYEDSNGNYPSNSWKQINGKWYYFDGTGYMAEGWRLVNNVWYYMQPGAGFMITGWIQTDGVWYYSNTSGAMQTGWIQVNGSWYYLSSNGSMLANTITPDGFKVDENGVWK